MKTTVAITVASLIIAIVCTVMAERRRSPSGARAAWAALLALYGVCVGVVSTALVYFFSLGVLTALAVGVPLGLPAFWAAVKVSER